MAAGSVSKKLPGIRLVAVELEVGGKADRQTGAPFCHLHGFLPGCTFKGRYIQEEPDQAIALRDSRTGSLSRHSETASNGVRLIVERRRREEPRTPKFIIEPHFRLQEWIAEEKGYFAAEGLDYEFREKIRATAGQHHDMGGQRVGAYQSFEAGRSADVCCACHWTVNVAASSGHGRLYADLYSVAPAGIFVAADSPIRDPADLADVPISVGWQSGSHYSTIQALEACLPADKINLSFAEGLLFRRLELLIDGEAPAVSLFSGPYYFAEQLSFRKIIDTTFMIATMIHGDPDPEDLREFFRALRRAQRDLDLRPDRYTHYYKNEFLERFHPLMDPPLGPRRAPGLRALHQGSPRPDLRLDRKARHLRRRRDGPWPLRRFSDFAGDGRVELGSAAPVKGLSAIPRL